MSKESHSFSIEVACKVGVTTAIIIQHLVHLHKMCMGNGDNFKQGRFWINKSVRAMAIIYPYLTPKEIRGCVDRLEKDGYIVSAHMAENRFDRTKWYSIEEKGFDLLSIPSDMRQNAIPDTDTAFDKRANADVQKGNSDLPKKANEKLPKGQMNNKVYYNNYSNCNSLSDSQAKSDRGSKKRKRNPEQEKATTAAPDAYTFAEFWKDYAFPKGSKKNALEKWNRLAATDREAIRATLETYKRGTATTDEGRTKFKPMRKHPERFLNARTWESVQDEINAHTGETTTEYDTQYEAYVKWVQTKYPAIYKASAHLSKSQYVTMHTATYVKGVQEIGKTVERNFLNRAHDEISNGVKNTDVYTHHCELLTDYAKRRQV